MNTIDVQLKDIRDAVDRAISHILLSWNEGQQEAVNPSKLLDALTNLECARIDIAALAKRLGKATDLESSEIAELASALQSKARPQ